LLDGHVKTARHTGAVEAVEEERWEGNTAVIHPIDMEDDPLYESVEEREWRVEQDTMVRKEVEARGGHY